MNPSELFDKHYNPERFAYPAERVRPLFLQAVAKGDLLSLLLFIEDLHGLVSPETLGAGEA